MPKKFSSPATRNKSEARLRRAELRQETSAHRRLLISKVRIDLVARAIHDRSSRSKKAFIKVNCAAIPATLLESESRYWAVASP